MAGGGAEAFYTEMGELILPAMCRLQNTLQFASEGAGKIHDILREVYTLDGIRKCIKANEPRRYHLQSR